jgi:murein DD-endopeptidase MepM/ murein hydrolase activator NlpD
VKRLVDHQPNPLDPEAHGNRARGWFKNLQENHRQRLSWAFAALLIILVTATTQCVFNNLQRIQPAYAEDQAKAVTPPPPELKEVVDHFKPNQTITEALLQKGLSSDLICQIVDCARPVYDLAKVRANRNYYLYFGQDGSFRDFRYPVDDERYLTVSQDAARDQMLPAIKDYPFEIRTANVSAVIDDSLYLAIVGIGESYQLAMDLADIFGYDIDFNTDIQKGDSFRALIEKKYLDGKFVRNGAVLAASISNSGKVFTGFRFEDENGKPAYFTPDGKALKRSFLKSPLKVFRITSRFSYGRMHPILKVVRPHLGVDYAAPIGTPVQAVGSGVVVGAGKSGANGKMVHLRHAGGYETKYLHLSKIAVKAGARVDQGEVIGYVGSSGLSTGPHLDFRITRHGKPLNPLKLIFPPSKPVAPEKLDRFLALCSKFKDEVHIANYETQLAQK